MDLFPFFKEGLRGLLQLIKIVIRYLMFKGGNKRNGILKCGLINIQH
jgi:hypothetical protein